MQVQPIKQTDIEIQGTTWLIADNSPLETCPICKVDIGCLNVCVEGHTLCEICFKDLQERNVLKCQKCPSKLFTEAEATNASGFLSRTICNTKFSCTSDGCDWTGDYRHLESHKNECLIKELACDYNGCGEILPRNKMKEHKQQCRKRPYREGNLDADYETIDEVKKLKHECEFLAQGPSLTRNEPDKQLYVRLIKFFPKVAEAALKETAPASDSQPVSHSMSSCGLLKLPCLYKCGFTAKSMDNFEKHFVDCPKKTISCRYCKKFEERRNIVKHEKNCPERTESCPYCEREVKQRELTPSQHFQSCTNYPVDCKLCQQVVVRSLLGEHQQSDCSGRKVVCNRCLTTTSAGELVAHKKSCRLMQPIILKGSPQIKLVPQVNAKGPFYQEEDGNTSTVYLPITRTRIEEMAGKHSMFPTYMQCTLAGKSTSVAESVYKVQVVGGEGHVYHWYFNLLHTRFSSDTSCRVDLIDDNQNYFPLFNKWGGVREINVNNRNEVMAVFDTGSKTIHDFLLKRSTDMHLVRIEATDQ